MYALFSSHSFLCMMKIIFSLLKSDEILENGKRYEKCIKNYKRIKIKFRKNDAQAGEREEKRDEEPLKAAGQQKAVESI
jgi:hypothetical protein